MPHWVDTVLHVAQWGTVPALLGGALSAWKFVDWRKRQRAALIAEDEATWRIRWDQPMHWTGQETGHYDLLNNSDAAKFSVSVKGKDGIDCWDAIYDHGSKALDSSYKPQTDRPANTPKFEVRWYVAQKDVDKKRKRPHRIAVWGQ